MQITSRSARLLLIAVAGGCFLATAVQASTNIFNFNGPKDPTADGTLQVFRSGDPDSPDAGQWIAKGGSPNDPANLSTNNGYLALTFTNGHRAVIVFKDFDAGAVVKAFNISMDVRIGAGSDSPADGFSISFARKNDPVIEDGDGFAAKPSGEENLPEEGTTTGLSVCFDAWDSGGGEVVGLAVRADGTIVTNIPMPVLNGSCTDPKSLQTGPNTKGVAGLCWQPVSIQFTTNQLLNVSYKGATLITNFALPSFKASAGRFILAGRTGGNYQEQDVDNLRIVTTTR